MYLLYWNGQLVEVFSSVECASMEVERIRIAHDLANKLRSNVFVIEHKGQVVKGIYC